MRNRILVFARAVLCGWAALLGLSYLLEGPLLRWTVPLLGMEWFPTERLALDCLVLTAAGWAAGRSHRSRAVAATLAFAVTLLPWNLDQVVSLDFPWLARLTVDAIRDSRYLGGLLTVGVTQAFLWGCLAAGGLLARPRPAPVSVIEPARATASRESRPD
jgi:hypothetical protein